MKTKEEIRLKDDMCKCNHTREFHGKSHSINYTQGRCEQCDCKNFDMPSERFNAVDPTVQYNRIIKFRAFDEENGMVQVDTLYFGKDGNISMPMFLLQGGKIMQFTGLLDRHGKEIYEGDIVKQANGEIREIRFGEFCFTGDEYSKHGIGFFSYGYPRGMFGTYSYPSKTDLIIGNIYEKPELLTN